MFGGELLSIVGLSGRGGLKDGGLPCGGCQRFKSAYLQPVNLADTLDSDSTEFCQFGSSIYDFSFMDVDKIFNKTTFLLKKSLLYFYIKKVKNHILSFYSKFNYLLPYFNLNYNYLSHI